MQHYSGFGLVKHGLSHHENWQRMWRNPVPKSHYDVIIVGGGQSGHRARARLRLKPPQPIPPTATSEKKKPSAETSLSSSTGNLARFDSCAAPECSFWRSAIVVRPPQGLG